MPGWIFSYFERVRTLFSSSPRFLLDISCESPPPQPVQSTGPTIAAASKAADRLRMGAPGAGLRGRVGGYGCSARVVPPFGTVLHRGPEDSDPGYGNRSRPPPPLRSIRGQ